MKIQNLIKLLFIISIVVSCNTDDDNQEQNFPENICVGDYTITSQDELEAFTANNCTKVEGFLKISGVNNLSSLVALQEVTGDFYIGENAISTNGNPDLSSLDGVNNLKYVGGRFIIGNNMSLSNINQLSNLVSVSSLRITANDALENCDNFNSLTTITNDFVFNSKASGIIEFENVETIGNYFGIISETATNVSFPNLTSVGNTFTLLSADALTILNLNSLNSIAGFEMHNAHSLANLDAFSSLTEITGDIDIYFNDSITNLSGFSNVTSITGGVYIDNNPLLVDFCGISGTPTDGNYYVFSNAYNPTQVQLNSNTECSN